ncbi:hypothetical protein BS78_10G233500 [Paspalum vaginatum]|nr:hypothetical protein BS78_10G233500 [Paspalum vaginatum]
MWSYLHNLVHVVLKCSSQQKATLREQAVKDLEILDIKHANSAEERTELLGCTMTTLSSSVSTASGRAEGPRSSKASCSCLSQVPPPYLMPLDRFSCCVVHLLAPYHKNIKCFRKSLWGPSQYPHPPEVIDFNIYIIKAGYFRKSLYARHIKWTRMAHPIMLQLHVSHPPHELTN